MAKITINQVSDQLLKRIPELKSGERAIYELAQNSALDVMNPDDSRTSKPVLPAMQGITNTATIYDGGQDKNILIGYVIDPGTKDREPRYGNIEFLASEGGRIVISDGKKQQELYRFLELHPANESNVNPDNVAPESGYVFRRVKPDLTAKQIREQMNKSLQAAATIEQATPTEITVMAQQLNINATRSEDEIVVDLLQIAKDRPDVILKKSADEQFKLTTLIADAQKAKVIKYDGEANAWRWGDTSEVVMSDFGGLPEESLIRFIQETEQGHKFEDKLIKALKNKKK